jgi:hypothetical protein
MKKTIALKIDVTKIDKERLYHSEKTGAKYLDAVLFYDSEKDQYDQNGMITESVSKEERADDVQGNILGNAKELGGNKPAPAEDIDDDDIPF